MKHKNIIPAIPGTTVIWYNAILDTTQEEAVLFWGASYEEGEDEAPLIVPFTLKVEGGYASPIHLPDKLSEGLLSIVISFNIPGWGVLSNVNSADNPCGYIRTAKGYCHDFQTNQFEPEESLKNKKRQP